MSWDHWSRRRVVTPDEARIWRAVTRDVAPLPGVVVPEEDPPAAPSAATAAPLSAVPVPPLSRPSPTPAVVRQLPPLSHGALPSVDKRSANRLKRGEMELDGRLDLHGLSQDAAHAGLIGFVRHGYESGRRCLLVITGKGLREGSGILRHQVPRWLNQSPLRDMILGFSHARPHHGGDGALYVLIRRQRPKT